jgi:hypothetical protein
MIQQQNWDDRDCTRGKTDTAGRERPVIGEHSKWPYCRFGVGRCSTRIALPIASIEPLPLIALEDRLPHGAILVCAKFAYQVAQKVSPSVY